jgi:hypothetical protein
VSYSRAATFNGKSGDPGLKEAVTFLSEKITKSKDPSIETPTKYKAFITACQRQTDNIQPRKIMFNGNAR